MKTVRILSHDEAVRYQPKEKTAIIRLLDSEAMLGDSDIRNEPLAYEQDFSSVFELVVDDIKRMYPEYPEAVLFSRAHARFLVEAFGQISEENELIVHCRAGVSRSAAVAILFCRYLKRLDLECELYLNHNIYPNSYILSFQERMGIEPIHEDLRPLLERLERQVIEADHESIQYTVKKILERKEAVV